jgi:anti-anti-sigma factor
MDHADTPDRRLALALAGELTIQVIAEQRATLLEALEAAPGADLVLNLQAVHGCDSAGVQLLLSAHQTLQRTGRRLWLGPLSPTLNTVLRTYGLASHFDAADAADVADAAEAVAEPAEPGAAQPA